MRAIAFYLPQFHPVPENDEWWGKGFTEWRNVTRARPLFPGHYQPHLPADLGFYDLRLPEVREAQAQMAREYGIHGFCYYHYWFNGRRILERPFNEVLASGKPDFPFCLCWANENWTRAWDGGDRHVLLEQHYGENDDRLHIRSHFRAFEDPRYIRIGGKPLFLVYRTELLPEPRRTADTWRNECRSAGIGDIYLARVEHFLADIDPRSIGFDAAVEFAPDSSRAGAIKFRGTFHRALTRSGLLSDVYQKSQVFSYPAMVQGMLNKPDVSFTRFRCVSPMWDNSARRRERANIYLNSTPETYGRWLEEICRRTLHEHEGDEQIVFINAWNEWAEGFHLEPDLQWGRAYLETTYHALAQVGASQRTTSEPLPVTPVSASSKLKKSYWRLREVLTEQSDLVRNVLRRPS